MDFLKNKWIWIIAGLIALFAIIFGFYRSSRNRKERDLLEQIDDLKEQEGIEFNGGTAEEWFNTCAKANQNIQKLVQDVEVLNHEKTLLQRKNEVLEQQFNRNTMTIVKDEDEVQEETLSNNYQAQGASELDSSSEKAAYELARKANTPEAWQAFLNQEFPTHNYKPTAGAQLKKLLKQNSPS